MLSITAWNAIRLVTSYTWYVALEAYAPNPGPTYVGITGGLWTLMGLVLLFSLWRRLRVTLPALLAAAFSYSAWIWADRLFVQAQIPATWPFAVAANILALGFATFVALDPRSRPHFGKEAHER